MYITNLEIPIPQCLFQERPTCMVVFEWYDSSKEPLLNRDILIAFNIAILAFCSGLYKEKLDEQYSETYRWLNRPKKTNIEYSRMNCSKLYQMIEIVLGFPIEIFEYY